MSSGEHIILGTAVAQIEGALALLDATEAPGDIGALLDLALCRLRSYADARGTDELVKPLVKASTRAT